MNYSRHCFELLIRYSPHKKAQSFNPFTRHFSQNRFANRPFFLTFQAPTQLISFKCQVLIRTTLSFHPQRNSLWPRGHAICARGLWGAWYLESVEPNPRGLLECSHRSPTRNAWVRRSCRSANENLRCVAYNARAYFAFHIMGDYEGSRSISTLPGQGGTLYWEKLDSFNSKQPWKTPIGSYFISKISGAYYSIFYKKYYRLRKVSDLNGTWNRTFKYLH